MSALVTEKVHENTSDFEEHGYQRQLIGWASRLGMFGVWSGWKSCKQ